MDTEEQFALILLFNQISDDTGAMSQETGKQFVIGDEQHTSACCLLDTSTLCEGLAIQRNTSKRDTKPFPTSRIFSTVLRGSSLLIG